MSYQGFVRPTIRFFKENFGPDSNFIKCETLRVLEIGVDRGQSTIPIIQNLTSKCYNGSFYFVGVDVQVRPELRATIEQFENITYMPGDKTQPANNVFIIEQNSLKFLEKTLPDSGRLFDLVFLDGDHNYKTVTKELSMLSKKMSLIGWIVIDDFNSRWADQDLYYSDRSEYKENTKATPRENSEKQGVRTAVQDFIRSNERWEIWDDHRVDMCILYRKDVYQRLSLYSPTAEGAINPRDLFWVQEFQPTFIKRVLQHTESEKNQDETRLG